VGQIAQGQRVVERQLLAVSISVVGRTPITGMWKTQKTLVPERTHPVGDAVVEAVDDRGDGDDGGDADDDAEDGEPGAQLVCPQRVERQLDGFASLSLCHGKKLSGVSMSSVDRKTLHYGG
jgi:hypothetical protein